MSRGRLNGLDGLRGLAACVVAFLYHPLIELNGDVAAHVPAVVAWLRDLGWTFVDLFFVISGYIFAHVYLRDGRLDRAGMTDFWVARIARLYPLHVVMLLVCAFLYGAAPENTAHAFVAHLFMLQAFVDPNLRHFNGPAWSISVEMLCYALFAIGVVLGERVLRAITALAILVPLVWFAGFGQVHGASMIECIPRGPLGFFLGQVLWRYRAPLARVPSWALAGLVATGLLLDIPGMSPIPPLALIAWPAAVLLALRLRALESPAMLWLGDRSYAVYLIHFPVLLYFLPYLHAAPTGWQSAAIIAAFAAVVLFYSDLAYRRFEVPARRAVRGLWKARTDARAVPA